MTLIERLRLTANFGGHTQDTLHTLLHEAADAIAAKDAEIKGFRERVDALDDALQFVERWACHHGVKPCHTPQEVLSVIQHYPPIKHITAGYANGKTPETPDPFACIAAKEKEISRLQRSLDDSASSLVRMQEMLRQARAIDKLKGKP